MKESNHNIKVKVFRFNPAKGKEATYQNYIVPFTKRMSVLNVLQYISEHFDGGLAYYISCRRGACAGCTVMVNGKARLACTELADDNMTIEPVSRNRTIKDLLVKPSDKEKRTNQ